MNLPVRQRAERRPLRKMSNDKFAQRIRDYWAAEGYDVFVEVVVINGLSVIQSDLINGLPTELWSERILSGAK
jgi:hypothetical protein